jgi:hypothetical protein
MIFYYWLKDARTGEVKRVVTSDYLGDTGESGFYKGIPVIIEDWSIDND